jgi:hypothetical protein
MLVRAPAVQAAQEVQVLQHGQLALQRGQVAEVGDGVGAAGRIGGAAFDLDAAGVRPQQAGKHAQQGGLAGAVAALHEQRLAGVDGKVQRAEHRLLVAGERQAMGGQQRDGSGVGHRRAL